MTQFRMWPNLLESYLVSDLCWKKSMIMFCEIIGFQTPTMSVDDVWFEPKVNKTTSLWTVCRRIVCAIIIAFSKVSIGFLNTTVIHNESTLRHAISRRRKGQGLITVLNHTSLLDPCLIPCYLGWDDIVHFDKQTPWTPGAREVVHCNLPQALFITLAKSLPIVRGDGVYQRTMNHHSEQLNRGEWVNIVPEGKINTTKEYIRYTWGVGRLFADCNMEPVVIPVYQIGLEDILPTGKLLLPRIGKHVTVVVGEPIDFKDTVKEMKERKASQEQIRKYITDVIQENMTSLAQRTKELHHSH